MKPKSSLVSNEIKLGRKCSPPGTLAPARVHIGTKHVVDRPKMRHLIKSGPIAWHRAPRAALYVLPRVHVRESEMCERMCPSGTHLCVFVFETACPRASIAAPHLFVERRTAFASMGNTVRGNSRLPIYTCILFTFCGNLMLCVSILACRMRAHGLSMQSQSRSRQRTHESRRNCIRILGIYAFLRMLPLDFF